MDTKIPIMIDMISQIIDFPKAWVDMSQYFREKDNDKKLAARINKKYNVIRDKRSYVINTINDKGFRIAAKLLAMKIVHKNKPN